MSLKEYKEADVNSGQLHIANVSIKPGVVV